MRRFLSLLLTGVLLVPMFQSTSAHAGLDATVDLTNPRIVPIYASRPGLGPTPGSEPFSGFLYSSRIVFSTAHAIYRMDEAGNKISVHEFNDLFVAPPNSKSGEVSQSVRVEKVLIATNYKYLPQRGLLDDFAIYILEKDLVPMEPVALLTPEIEKVMIENKTTVRMHGYGEYLDRCASGETAPCSRKASKPQTEFPRTLQSNLVTLAEVQAALGMPKEHLAEYLKILNGRAGFGCNGDSGGSITAIFNGELHYLGPTPNGDGVYACGAGQVTASGGVNYSTPIYRHLDIVDQAKAYVAGQIERERSAAEEAAKAKEEMQVAPPKKETQKKSRITCIKGSKSKVVRGLKPKCPNGFRVK